MKKIWFILLGIIVLAVFLRVYQIGIVPPSPDWDEAALGYNAYSILKTGHDEYGKFLPVVLRSFDDYKPALYTYLIIPFIPFFDLSIISVRLPSIVFGIIGIVATYYLVLELFRLSKKETRDEKLEQIIALLVAFLLSISPWHTQFSRVGFEANVGLTFNILMMLFFLKSLKKKIFLPFSVVCGVAAIYSYQSEKVFTPLLFLGLLIIFRKKVSSLPKSFLTFSALLGFLFLLPMLFYIVTNPQSLTRAKGVSIFTDKLLLLNRNTEKLNTDRNNNDVIGLILDNRRIEYAKATVAGYISHFDLNWLFIRGDEERHHAPFMGLLYLFELPFLFIGMYQVVFGILDRRAKALILTQFFLAPLPASITSGVPHAVRTLNFLPTFQIFVAFGLAHSFLYTSKLKLHIKYILFSLFALIFLFNISYFLNQYFVQQNYYHSKDWQYGYKELVDYVAPVMGRYNNVIVSNVPPLDQSYIFFLYYMKYDPAKYLQQGGTRSGGFEEEHGNFENLNFRPIHWDRDRTLKNTMVIGLPNDLPVNIDKTIYYLNGEEAAKVTVTAK